MKRVLNVDPANWALQGAEVGEVVLVSGRQMKVVSIDVENGRVTVED